MVHLRNLVLVALLAVQGQATTPHVDKHRPAIRAHGRRDTPCKPVDVCSKSPVKEAVLALTDEGSAGNDFCLSFLGVDPVIATATVSTTLVSTIVINNAEVITISNGVSTIKTTVIENETITVTVPPSTTVTDTTTSPIFVSFQAPLRARDDEALSTPSAIADLAASDISQACSCLVGPSPTPLTSTTTKTATAEPNLETITSIATSFVTVVTSTFIDLTSETVVDIATITAAPEHTTVVVGNTYAVAMTTTGICDYDGDRDWTGLSANSGSVEDLNAMRETCARDCSARDWCVMFFLNMGEISPMDGWGGWCLMFDVPYMPGNLQCNNVVSDTIYAAYNMVA